MKYPAKATRVLLTLVLLCGAHLSSTADPVSPQRAKAIASQYIHVGDSPATKKMVSQSVKTTPYYIFEGVGGRGFAVIPSDDALGEVLAYSPDGRIDTTAASPAKAMLQDYAEAWSECRSGRLRPVRSAHPGKKIGPLMKTTWNQGAPYNCMLPNHYPYTGCGSTATAQVMYYHQWPERGKGSNFYVNTDGDTIGADFSKSIYRWDKMRLAYNSFGWGDSINQQAVGLLMRDVGLASTTTYADSWSGAWGNDLCRALNNNFDYSASHYYRQYEGPQRFYDMIVSEIESGFPVVLGGGRNGSGHIFVGDGVDEQGLIHLNFGWGSSEDGFYSIPYARFRQDMDCILIHPNKVGSAPMPEQYLRTSPQLQFTGSAIMTATGLETEGKAARRTDNVNIKMAEFINYGLPFRGDMGLMVVNEKGVALDTISSVLHQAGGFTTQLSDGELCTDGLIVEEKAVNVSLPLKGLPSGYYRLKPVAAAYNAADGTYGHWVPLRTAPQFELHLTADSMRVSEQGGPGRGYQLEGQPAWSKPVIKAGDDVSVTLPLANLRGMECDGTLIVTIINTQTGKEHSVGVQSFTIDKYFTDSVQVTGTIPLNCADGIYRVQLMVDGNAVNPLHNSEAAFVAIGNVATGIGAIRAETEGRNGRSEIYDLQGRRVTRPAHGIYIVNGKKRVVK